MGSGKPAFGYGGRGRGEELGLAARRRRRRGEIWGRMIGGRREGTRQVYPPSEAIVRREETGVAISEPPKGRRRERDGFPQLAQSAIGANVASPLLSLLIRSGAAVGKGRGK